MTTACNIGNIGFIGLGQMATALASGFLRAGLVSAERLFGFDVSPDAAARFASTTGATVCADAAETVARADVVFFAVKPQYMSAALAPVRAALSDAPSSKLLVSIAAGLPISYFESALFPEIRLVRVMPNTPALVGAGASGFARSQNATPEDAALVGDLLRSVGSAFELAESQLDAVTGLSGSGPAFVFLALEALADGGVKAGLPRPIALELAAQTLKGGAEMYLQTRKHPGELKDAVTSPAGTTIAGVAALEERGFRSALIEAVDRATKRSRELGAR
ncbi:MAG: pyrroline-5-carboxylate reductase [Thermoguttaceae bacterium]|nr:pyrroline-5-carboxylate reductase [Thermoguttaceae bacterium]